MVADEEASLFEVWNTVGILCSDPALLTLLSFTVIATSWMLSTSMKILCVISHVEWKINSVVTLQHNNEATKEM